MSAYLSQISQIYLWRKNFNHCQRKILGFFSFEESPMSIPTEWQVCLLCLWPTGNASITHLLTSRDGSSADILLILTKYSLEFWANVLTLLMSSSDPSFANICFIFLYYFWIGCCFCCCIRRCIWYFYPNQQKII